MNNSKILEENKDTAEDDGISDNGGGESTPVFLSIMNGWRIMLKYKTITCTVGKVTEESQYGDFIQIQIWINIIT